MDFDDDDVTVLCPRIGETAKQIKFRADRLFSVGVSWYFNTREGIDKGPFSSKQQAEHEINKFIRKIGFDLIRDESQMQ